MEARDTVVRNGCKDGLRGLFGSGLSASGLHGMVFLAVRKDPLPSCNAEEMAGCLGCLVLLQPNARMEPSNMATYLWRVFHR